MPHSFAAFHGMEEVCFTAPLRLDGTIRPEAEVVGVDAKDAERGVLTGRSAIPNPRDETGSVAVTKHRCGRRA